MAVGLVEAAAGGGEDGGCGIRNDVVRLGELRELAHRGSPWWV